MNGHRSGATLRYLVGGPSNGVPAILVQGMMFPVLLRGIAGYLEANSIRLYVPIRTGYLESRALGTLFERGDSIDQSMVEIARIAVEEKLAPVALIGKSLGAPVAARLLEQYPDLFSGLILMSANLARPTAASAQSDSSFYAGRQSPKRETLLFKLVNLEYQPFYGHSHTCRHILKTHFAECKTDVDVLEGRFCGRAEDEQPAGLGSEAPAAGPVYDTVIFWSVDGYSAGSGRRGVSGDGGFVTALNGDLSKNGWTVTGSIGVGRSTDIGSSTNSVYGNLLLGYVWQLPDLYVTAGAGLNVVNNDDTPPGSATDGTKAGAVVQ